MRTSRTDIVTLPTIVAVEQYKTSSLSDRSHALRCRIGTQDSRRRGDDARSQVCINAKLVDEVQTRQREPVQTRLRDQTRLTMTATPRVITSTTETMATSFLKHHVRSALKRV